MEIHILGCNGFRNLQKYSCISLYINKHQVKKKYLVPGDRDHLPAVRGLRVRPHTSAREAWQAGKDSS